MIPTTLIHAAYRRALRTGRIWRLKPLERAILTLTIKTLKTIKSRILLETLGKILEKICPSPRLLLKLRALEVGLEILKRKAEQAAKLGHRKAWGWLLDLETAFYMGISYMNTPPIYRPP